MSEQTATKTFTLSSEEKATMVMIYTLTSLVRGEVITRETMRVSTWLRTQAAPDYIRVYNAQVLTSSSAGVMQNFAFHEFHVPTPSVLAFHMVPPAEDPIDYDASEPNRKMENVTLLVGTFRFDGHLRMANQVNLFKYLETSKEPISSVYDIKITNPGMRSMGTLHVPFALVRLPHVLLAAGE